MQAGQVHRSLSWFARPLILMRVVGDTAVRRSKRAKHCTAQAPPLGIRTSINVHRGSSLCRRSSKLKSISASSVVRDAHDLAERS